MFRPVFKRELLCGIVLHQRNVALRRKRRNGMLVNHLLATFAVDNDREIIEGTDDAADLEAVR